MDKIFDALIKFLEELDPRTAIIIILLIAALVGAYKVIKFLYMRLNSKEKEVTDLHKVYKEDGDANVRLMIELQNTLKKLIEQGDKLSDKTDDLYKVLSEMKIKLDMTLKK